MSGFFSSFGSSDSSPLEGLEPVQEAPSPQPAHQQTPGLAAFMSTAPPLAAGRGAPAPEMSESRRRFYKASLYMQIAEASAFENGDAIAGEVDAECKAFYERRVTEVMAGKTDDGESAILTEKHMRFLAQFANSMMRRPDIQQAFGMQPGAEAPEPQEVEPPKPRPRPQARTRQLSSGAVPPAAQSQPAPPPSAPAPQKLAAKRPPATPTVALQAEPQAAPAPMGLPAHNSVFDYEGRKFRAKHVPMGVGDQGPQHRPAIEAMAPGTAIELDNGVIVARRENGSFFKFLKLDVTKPARAAHVAPLPIPTGQAMEFATASQAVKTVAAMNNSAQNVAAHLLK